MVRRVRDVLIHFESKTESAHSFPVGFMLNGNDKINDWGAHRWSQSPLLCDTFFAGESIGMNGTIFTSFSSGVKCVIGGGKIKRGKTAFNSISQMERSAYELQQQQMK